MPSSCSSASRSRRTCRPGTPLETQALVLNVPGLPSDVLLRRPDILSAKHALIGAARAAFFPSITLTGTVGSSSLELCLSELRYRHRKGVDSYLVLLTAQRDLHAAQALLIQSRFVRLANLVDLYRALGGGWQERTPASVQREAPVSPKQDG